MTRWYRIRRLITAAHEKIRKAVKHRLPGLIDAADPTTLPLPAQIAIEYLATLSVLGRRWVDESTYLAPPWPVVQRGPSVKRHRADIPRRYPGRVYPSRASR